ncbi:dof zinc finger protein DOF5.6 [Brachypodium distachyon]|uniref:Dof zinc finger protein n=1 Tax=Brachypodium distachyon TaxID=15368 RepID=I1ID22_BRADI|nr:dof zinc finger protein DOF5.6 [Brachypodium distachyon]KQK00955.1 hypothetical protein BRADI_3g52880v3 [Brachypodium distachyon]|eukprot:XP_003570200.1 dof zinc finger protein DOF5.6 [Brachypodium distachyon]
MMAGAAHPMHFCMDSDWLKGMVVPEDQGGAMGSSSPSSPSDTMIIACPQPMQQHQAQQQDRRLRPQHDSPLKCPRCDSAHTKFCYYNNYSLSQPRYFCKTCRRYWTKGGSLRNVPVGGGCRKNKRATRKPSSSSAVVVPVAPSPAMPMSMMLHGGRHVETSGGLHLSFSGSTMQLPSHTSAPDPLCSSLGLLDWKYDNVFSGSGGGTTFESANSEAAHFTGQGMMGIGGSRGGADCHALDALRYAASLGMGEHLALPFGAGARAERDHAVEMKPLSLEWCGEASRVPESSTISSLSGLGLWSGMISGAHHHHGSSAAI